MKIVNRVTILNVLLVSALCINTLIGLNQLTRMGGVLNRVVTQDFLLFTYVNAIATHQLEKTILFERVLRIAEEVGFENVSVSRKKYLRDYIEFARQGMENLTNQVNKNIVDTEKLLADYPNVDQEQHIAHQYSESLKTVAQLHQKHDKYNQLLIDFFNLLNKDNYKVSFADIERIQAQEQKISSDTTELLDSVKAFTQKAVLSAQAVESRTRKILLSSSAINLVIALFLALSIVRRISRPLSSLEKAARDVGSGNFDVNLKANDDDEIGAVSHAFKDMAEKIDFYSTELENKSRDLQENLELTNEQKKDLEKVNKELDRFAYTVSHDLGAPLMGISWYAKYLDKHYKDNLDEKGQNAVAGIVRSSDRLHLLIKDLLTLTRISRVKNPFEKTDLNETLQAVLERLEFHIKTYNVVINMPEQLPVLVCDRIKIAEVFLNLISNGIKFSSNHTNSPVIDIAFSENNKEYEFCVKDNGIGIDPKYHTEIFDIFRRLHEVGEYEGSGAGLSIVKEIIEDHNGRIWIESEEGQGAAFHFIIPQNLKVGTEPT